MRNLPNFTQPPQPQQAPQTAKEPVKRGLGAGFVAIAVLVIGGLALAFTGRQQQTAPEPEKTEGEKIREEIKRQKDPAAVALGKRGGRPRKKKPETEKEKE